MIAQQSSIDPSDLRHCTIQNLFYRQIRNITMKSCDKSIDQKMRSFDLQFSDAWF